MKFRCERDVIVEALGITIERYDQEVADIEAEKAEKARVLSLLEAVADKTDEEKSRAHWKTESVPHFRNWIAAIRSRKRQELNAAIEEGFISTGLPLLGNASYRLGRTLHFDPKTEQCIDDDEANQLLGPAYREPYIVPQKV